MNKAATRAGWDRATPAPSPADEANHLSAGLGPGLGPGLGSGHIAALAGAAEATRARLETAGHAPDSEKGHGTRVLRRFGLAELARHAYDLPPERLRGLVRARPEWPQGLIESPGAAPRFTLPEVTELRAALEAEGRLPALPRRPQGLAAKTIAFANFKGGVGKTSTAAAMAMAAAIDGYRVLVVDLDSQGSMTALLGGQVADEWQTAFAAIARDFAREISASGGAPDETLDETLARAATVTAADLVQQTHWPGLDLIGAELNLYWAEFQIPVWRMRHRAWALWDALARFLEADGLTDRYDLVILDTPPALGYLTINALAAADIVMVPLGATFLDFAATGRFLDMIATTFASIETAEGEAGLAFEWDALRLLLTRYDPAQQADMAALIREAMGPALATETQEATALVGQAGEGARAVYEADPRDFNRDTYLRGRETFDRTWGELRDLIGAAWAADLKREGAHGPA